MVLSESETCVRRHDKDKGEAQERMKGGREGERKDGAKLGEGDDKWS